MRYLPNKTNLYFYHDDIDATHHSTNVRFASYDSTIVPEKGEVITGPFGYYGATVQAEVISCEPGGSPVGICYDIHLRQIEDGKCLFCRAENGMPHYRIEDKYLCPAVVE